MEAQEGWKNGSPSFRPYPSTLPFLSFELSNLLGDAKLER